MQIANNQIVCNFIKIIHPFIKLYIMKLVVILLFLAILLPHTHSYLCSAYCGPASCSGPTSSSCQNSCPTHWVLSESSCIPDTAAGYTQIATSNDLGGTIQITPSTTTGCGVYTYFGDITCVSSFQISLASGVGIPHYSIEISAWVIFTDDSKWQNGKNITLAEGVNSIQYTMGTTPCDQQVVCGGKTQTSLRVSLSQAHINSTSTPIAATLSNDVTMNDCFWGIKQVVIIAQTCHSYCWTCNSPLNTQCYSCVTTYFLSGNTCSTACLAGYGSVTGTNVCILCDLKCITCAETATNCSSCTASGANAAYLYLTSCVASCPTKTLANNVTRVCDSCPSNCDTCTSSTVCTVCSSTYGLYYSLCYNPCPTTTYESSGVCTSCPSNCDTCTSGTVCTVCISPYGLYNSLCYNPCPDTTFYSSGVCTSCPSNCDTCTSGTVCSVCANTYGLYNSLCYNPCPTTTYYSGGICSSCPSNCDTCTSTTVCTICSSTYGLYNSLCYNPCPNTTYYNSGVCSSCPSNCDTCTSGTLCTVCTNTYGLYNSLCYNPCPTATYYSSGVCVSCDPKCLTCSLSPTTCSVCSNTSPNIAYLSGTSCLTSCPLGNYPSINPNLCLTCDLKCSACTGPASTQCSSCTTTSPNEAFLSGTSCVVTCSLTFFGNTVNHQCISCPSNCDICTSTTVCTTCTSPYLLFNSTCVTNCPAGTFTDIGVCTACDFKCLTCTGALDTQCQSCATGYTLSGSTCAAACLPTYGPSSIVKICISCIPYCLSCNLVNSNCSSCVTSGANEAFLNTAASPNPTCVLAASCPSTTFANQVDHICEACNSNCETCSVVSTNCTSCATGMGWSSYVCYNICPVGTFMNGTNCSVCDPLCTACQNSSTNCSVCSTTSPIAYLLVNTCYSSCPGSYYNNNNGGAGPNLCTTCTTACTLCLDGTATNCQACSTSYTLSGTTCSTSCLSGYGPSATVGLCLLCTYPCLTCNLTATNCTTCDISLGPMFLYNTGSYVYTCVVSCPIGTFLNLSTSTCDPCPNGCVQCDNLTYCYSCNYSAGFRWVNTTHKCYSTCPIGFYAFNSTNCSACLQQCAYCKNVPYNCTGCYTSGSYRGFLYNASCYLGSCFAGMYGNTTTNKCQPCNSNCAICIGPTKNNCTLCNNVLMLSNYTCDTTCLSGYGVSNEPFYCLACNATCTTCAYIATNCSACQTTGSFSSFLMVYNQTYSQCLQNCTSTYFENYATLTCDSCNINCTACNFDVNNCSACVSGFALLNNTCYSPCPDGYYLNGLICSKCNNKCLLCTSSPTNCQACVISGASKSYLFGSACLTSCSAPYYNSDNGGSGPTVCLRCDLACLSCYGTSTNCSSCAPNYYTFNSSSCVSVCPTGYFPYNTTYTCLDSSLVYVTLSPQMYFTSSAQNQIYVDLTFDRDLNTSTFPLTTFQSISFSDSSISSSNFTFTYTWINASSYRISLKPNGFIFLYRCKVTVITMSQPSVIDKSLDGANFHPSVYNQIASLIWNCISSSQSSQSIQGVINLLSDTSNKISQFTTLPFIQQINKAGLLSMIFPACQITSSIIVTNSVYSQHFYEGSRFFSNFVYFETPKWEKERIKEKYVFVPNADKLVANYRLLNTERQLYDTSNTSWRYQRTGFTTFFFVDCSTQLILIAMVWLMVLVGRKLEKSCKWRVMPKVYSIFHAVHEIMIFYFSMGLVLEWTYFDSSSTMRILSLVIAIAANIYLLIYVLYIYYKFIDYSDLEVGSEKFREVTLKYGSFVRNLRYEEYEPFQRWSPRHLFRTYNYHLLSYYKKFLMIVSLPIFYEYQMTQIGVLIALQVMETVRFCLTWPYISRRRNIYKLVLQLVLLLFFVISMVQVVLIGRIQQNQLSTLSQSIYLYNLTGWIGVVCIFFFNLSYFVLLIINLVDHCKKSDMEKVREIRRDFYYEKLSKYEKSLDKNIGPDVLDSWVVKGDLNEKWIEDESENTLVRLTIQKFIINKMGNGFAVQVSKVVKAEVRKTKFGNLKQKVKVIQRMQGTIGITKQLYNTAIMCKIIQKVFKKYDPEYKANFLTLKTIVKIDTSFYGQGDQVRFKKQQLSQVVILNFNDDKNQTYQINDIIEGFPLNPQLLRNLVNVKKQKDL